MPIPLELLSQFRNRTLPRGIRNNNPGNIDYNPSNDWKGQINPQDIPEDARDTRFAQFQTPEHGIRAMIQLFKTYQSKYSLNSTRELIGRWAPPTENDTASYVKSVASSAHIDPSLKVNFTDPNVAIGFIKAVVAHEGGKGQYYEDAVYERAFALTK